MSYNNFETHLFECIEQGFEHRSWIHPDVLNPPQVVNAKKIKIVFVNIENLVI